MPLAPSRPDAQLQLTALTPDAVFPGARSPKGAMSGLYLYLSMLGEAHTIAQELSTAEGSFWHGIMHRQEPDPENAAYWFRQTGRHAVFPALATAAMTLGYPASSGWDPFAFIGYCEAARRKPDSAEEDLAKRVQLAEWQLLFHYCAGRP